MAPPSQEPPAHSIAPTVADLPRPLSFSSSSSSERAFAVHLGPVGYAVAWTSIYLFHVTCLLYCVAAAVLFRDTQDAFMVTYFDIKGKILSPRFFPAVATVHYVIAAIHACFIVAPLVGVVFRFVTDRHHSGPSRTESVLMSRLASVRLPEAIEQYIPRALRKTARTMYARVFARQGLFGIESRHFDILVLLREALACGLQTYQAFQMCQSLPRRGLNRLYVATLIAKCWITPALHFLVKNKPLRRLLDRLFDVALDFLAAVGVPVVLVASYWPLYDSELGDFAPEYWEDELWVATVRTESPLVFFGSWIDALSRLVFSFGLLLSLDDIKILVKRRRTTLGAVKPHSIVKTNPQSSSRLVARGARKALRLGHGLLFGFGVVVLAVHLHSELRAAPKACLLPLSPWLVAKPTCVIVEFSCYTNRAYTGDTRDFNSVFEDLNPPQTDQIRFRHCRSIDVQPSIRQFSQLTELRFYNSTVREWGAHAALTNASHPKLVSTYFFRTNFTNGSLPDGMLAQDFPRSVVDMLFSITNLQFVPDDLDERWPMTITLGIEFSPLAQYPLVFTRMQIIGLSLMGNAITDVPADAFQVSELWMLALSGNPITELPEDVAFAGGVSVILLDSTNLTVVPMWVLDAAAMGTTYVSAGLTPYCASVGESESLSGSSASESESDLGSGASESKSDLGGSSSESDGLSASSASESESLSGSEPTDGTFWSVVDCTFTGPDYGTYRESDDLRASEVW